MLLTARKVCERGFSRMNHTMCAATSVCMYDTLYISMLSRSVCTPECGAVKGCTAAPQSREKSVCLVISDSSHLSQHISMLVVSILHSLARYCKFDAITQMADMYSLPYTGVIDRPDLQVWMHESEARETQTSGYLSPLYLSSPPPSLSLSLSPSPSYLSLSIAL